MKRRRIKGGLAAMGAFSLFFVGLVLYKICYNPDSDIIQRISDPWLGVAFLIWNCMMFAVGYLFVKEFETKLSSYQFLYNQKYPGSSPEVIEKKFKREFIGTYKRKLWIMIAGLPIAYFVFEGRVPSTIGDWIISASLVLCGMWLYFSSKSVSYESWD